jgi:uncharacterized protein YndB with AHSA1/START domain
VTDGPAMTTHLVVRRPVEEVFAHLVDPSLVTRFWFDETSGPLEPGADVRWTWTRYDAHADVHVSEVEAPRRVAYDWGTPVEWTFEPHEHGTVVRVTETGFTGTPAEVTAHLVDTTVGHTKVLCALKALAEHGVDLRIVEDQ